MEEVQQLNVKGDVWGLHLRNLKDTTRTEDSDIIYASFSSEVYRNYLGMQTTSVFNLLWFLLGVLPWILCGT